MRGLPATVLGTCHTTSTQVKTEIRSQHVIWCSGADSAI